MPRKVKIVARLEFANALRGLAALSVVIGHYNGFFFGSAALIGTMTNSPAPLREASPMLDAWHAFFEAIPLSGGEFGVALFFLISGFVIPMSLEKYDWRGFLVGRVMRIYPTYFAGFTVTLVALWVAGSLYGRPFPFDAGAVLIHYVPGLRDVTWSPHIDYVIWTLEIEVRFYAVCALASIWLRRGDFRVFAIPLVLAGCAIAIQMLLPGWYGSHALAYRLGYVFTTVARFLAFMFIGVAFCYHYRRRLGTIALATISSALLVLCWVLWRKANDTLSWEVGRSFAFALAVFSVSYAYSHRWPSSRILDFFADVSYPLYLVHGVAGYVSLRIMMEHNVNPIVSIMIAVSGALLVSWILHIAVELPTHRLGQRWARAVTRREDAGGAPAHSRVA
jgi:peptidoglycan/LPS O-acetylase OafA/YrhL